MGSLYVATGDAFAQVKRRDGGWRASLSLRGQGVQRVAHDPR